MFHETNHNLWLDVTGTDTGMPWLFDVPIDLTNLTLRYSDILTGPSTVTIQLTVLLSINDETLVDLKQLNKFNWTFCLRKSFKIRLPYLLLRVSKSLVNGSGILLNYTMHIRKPWLENEDLWITRNLWSLILGRFVYCLFCRLLPLRWSPSLARRSRALMWTRTVSWT